MASSKSGTLEIGADVLKMDFMVKKSQQKGRFKVDNLKNRWFVLRSGSLTYLDGELGTGPSKEKGRINLYNIQAIEEVDPEALGNKPNAFQVVYREDVNSEDIIVLYILATHRKQRDEWITALRNACETCGVTFATKYHPGIWQGKPGRYTCCDSISRNMEGCKRTTFLGSKAPFPSASNGSILTAPNRVPTVPPKNLLREKHGSELKRVLALHDYLNAEPDDLSLTKGEEYIIINDSKPHWWLAKNKRGETGYIPANYVEASTDHGLEKYDWYYKDCTREKSAEILKKEQREGCFLVRDSSVNGMYTLSICTKETQEYNVRHYHIKKNLQGKFYLAEKHAFETIPELIFYHKHNCAGLIVRLRSPPSDRSSLQPATAGFGHDLFEIDPSELEFFEILGSGQFGTVKRARWRGKTDVAVKTMLTGTMSEEDFIAEARTMMELQHPHLVQLYGVSRQQPIFLITEYMKNGSLLHYVRRKKHDLKAPTMLEISIQVCSGMQYLETKGFIHRDLAARNCLVGENLMIKVGDFGLARFVLDDEYTSSSGTKFPIKWAPPEVLSYTKFSSKSDVWAFGVLMWEIYTGGDMPYGRTNNTAVVEMVCHKNKRLNQPPSCARCVYEVMYSCWNKEAEQRPTFGRLCADLKKLQDEYNQTDYAS